MHSDHAEHNEANALAVVIEVTGAARCGESHDAEEGAPAGIIEFEASPGEDAQEPDNRDTALRLSKRLRDRLDQYCLAHFKMQAMERTVIMHMCAKMKALQEMHEGDVDLTAYGKYVRARDKLVVANAHIQSQRARVRTAYDLVQNAADEYSRVWTPELEGMPRPALILFNGLRPTVGVPSFM